MKLFRHGPPGLEMPGIVADDGILRDASSVVPDWSGKAIDPAEIPDISKTDLVHLPKIDTTARIGPCVGGVRKIVCVGLNYADHAAEAGTTPPIEPILFLKASVPTGPYDDVPLPRSSTKTDWEVELGVVIGRTASYVQEAEARQFVVGYCVTNDYSERAWQLEGTGTWDKGKGCNGFAPIGPWLVTKDEVPDPQNLTLSLDVNGKRMQSSTTAQMIFGVDALVSYVSSFMTLYPGDIISTGTPPGVGMGCKPPRFLAANDVVELTVEGLGHQRQRIVEAN